MKSSIFSREGAALFGKSKVKYFKKAPRPKRGQEVTVLAVLERQRRLKKEQQRGSYTYCTRAMTSAPRTTFCLHEDTTYTFKVRASNEYIVEKTSSSGIITSLADTGFEGMIGADR